MIKVYVHGRPQGQDIWSATPVANDKFYLHPFLDSRIGENMNSVLQIDIWQNNAYYSYIHRKSVIENGNRPGAYFAITICFENHLCTQVALLYGLLESVYKQLCLNNIIEANGEHEHFLISQFSEKENVLNQISTVIIQNINKYIVSTLKPINNNVDTTKTQYKTYSNIDVDSPQFLQDCTTSRLLVAPSIVSKDKLPAELKQKISIIEGEKDKLVEDRNKWQSKAEHESAENKCLVEEKDKLHTQISALQQELERAKQRQKKDGDEHSSNDNSSSPSQQPNDLPPIADIHDIKSLLNNIISDIRRMAGRFPVAERYVTMVTSLLSSIILLTAAILYFVDTQKNNSVSALGEQLITIKDTVVLYEPLPLVQLPYSTNARINIKNFNGGDLKVENKYVLELRNFTNFKDFHWVINGNAKLDGDNSFVVTGVGNVEILCVDSRNYIIVSRELKSQ